MKNSLVSLQTNKQNYHRVLWKILKEMEIPDHLTCLLRNQVKKQHLEPDMEQ